MTAPIRERQLLQPVTKFLRELGCKVVVPELDFFDRGIDLYAVRTRPKALTYAIELKLYDWQKALRQAAIYQLCCDFSYVALPMSKAVRVDTAVFEQSGIGLLGVENGGSVSVLLQPRRSTEQRLYYVRTFRRLILREARNADK